MKQSSLKDRVLVDTSSFIDYFREGQNNLVPNLALNNEIVLCQIVRLELLKGARRAERALLQNFLEGLFCIKELPIPVLIEKALFRLHGRGINLGLADVIILTDALQAGCRLLSSDQQMIKAARVLGVASMNSRSPS